MYLFAKTAIFLYFSLNLKQRTPRSLKKDSPSDIFFISHLHGSQIPCRRVVSWVSGRDLFLSLRVSGRDLFLSLTVSDIYNWYTKTCVTINSAKTAWEEIRQTLEHAFITSPILGYVCLMMIYRTTLVHLSKCHILFLLHSRDQNSLSKYENLWPP